MDARPPIVWLASFPKSGNTWFRLLLANLLFGGDSPVDINRVAIVTSASRTIFDESTLLESGMLSASEVEALRPGVLDALAGEAEWPFFIKTHDVFRHTASGPPLHGSRATVHGAIYLVRDPRDVAVSYAHHAGCDLDAAVGVVTGRVRAKPEDRAQERPLLHQETGNWSEHVSSWIRHREFPTFVLKYEALHEDTERAFGEALAFLGIDASPEEIARAVRHAAFDELQRQERAAGFRERLARSPFFRSGRVGDWRGVLTPAQKLEIETSHRKMLRHFAYDLTC